MSNRWFVGSGPRLSLYLAVGLASCAVIFLVAPSVRLTSLDLHTQMETAACLLSLFAGTVALVRYYSRRDLTYLLVAAAFLGTGLMEGLHGALTSSYLRERLPTVLASLAPWSFFASRLFLAVGLWLSVALPRLRPLRRNRPAVERTVFAATGLLILACVFLFSLVPLQTAFFPSLVFTRPVELVPALVFLLALVGYVRKDRWREDAFEHWLVVSLMVSVLSEGVLLPFSSHSFDGLCTAGHVTKLVSFACVVAGLVRSMFELFRQAEIAGRESHRVRLELENEIGERRRAESDLVALAETLEKRVAERTNELARSRTAALNMMKDAEEARRAAELAEELVVRYARELERSNADLQQFAYVASHDLQEPLRQMAGYAQLLERRYRGRLDDDADDFIGYIVAGARRMQQLIRDLLSFSRVGTRAGAMAAIPCDSIVDRVLADLKQSIDEAEARIERDSLPAVTADGSQLSQLFLNLISNAIKFRGQARPEVHISAERKNGDWLFQVRDNGIGISPAFADKVFAVFQRLHGRAEYPGTGIGLAICKRIVERHDGRIWVEPNPEGGSTFSFTIPATAEIERPEETQTIWAT